MQHVLFFTGKIPSKFAMTGVAVRRINTIRRFHTCPSLQKKKRLPLLKTNMSSSGINKQDYDYFMVLDFEATCDNVKNLEPQVVSYEKESFKYCSYDIKILYKKMVNRYVNVWVGYPRSAKTVTSMIMTSTYCFYPDRKVWGLYRVGPSVRTSLFFLYGLELSNRRSLIRFLGTNIPYSLTVYL